MKKLFKMVVGARRPMRFSLLLCLLGIVAANGAEMKEARVTQIINDVKLLGGQGGQRSAAVSDEVRNGNAVRTGTESRAELTFTDLTITRLGANTIFSFNADARELNLSGGAVLVEVPRNAPAIKVNTAAVTAAITGGTALFEYHQGTPAKLLIMEGKGQACSKIHTGECETAVGGEMLTMTADGHIMPPTKFNVALVTKTSKLIKGFPPLANADLISAVIDQQQTELTGGNSATTTPKDPTDIDTTSQATTANGGSGAKFGPPTAIKQPNPYDITGNTQINTDPTITTDSVSNTGKIYRGSPQDGPLPEWLGSTTSAFDSVQEVTNNGPDDGGFVNPGSGSGNHALPLAGFVFSGLDLSGDPTITDANGVNLVGFASQGGITVTTPTTFTFSNTPATIGLIALNGSIDLSQGTFQNFGELFVYARGGGSSVTVGSAASQITNLNRVQLRAEGDINVNGPVSVNGTAQDHRGFKALAGNNITINAPITSSSGEILVQAQGGINLTSSSQLHSLLDATNGTGPIVIYASASDTTINVAGSVQADQGEVDIRQVGLAGSTTLNNATIHGDVVKIAALGNNGTVNIGNNNSISADSVLKLYAPGSNGTLHFLGSVTLNSPSTILAANTITIDPTVVVTVNMPGGTPATVYTENANYFGFGGNAVSPGSAGTFSGAGAQNPQHLNLAPTLGGPGQGP